MTTVTVAELGCANTGSVVMAFERLGATVVLSDQADTLAAAERLILPGVGAAGFAMQRIHSLGLYELLRTFSRPLLGVCLGQQLLFEHSDEGDVAGLGRIPGRVTTMTAAPDRPVPHMGWNTLESLTDDPLMAGISPGDYAYFVHSYACPVGDFTLARCTYGTPFSAVVRRGNVWGAQFHPERSARAGRTLLANFLSVPC